jgi:MFS family permease
MTRDGKGRETLEPADPAVIPARDTRLWWIAVGLSVGPAVSNGLARFAYGLVLPAMRDDLAWSYTEAGWLNTANAIGYLAGALAALAAIRRFGPRNLFIAGMVLTTLALILSGLTRDFWVLTAWRILAGIGGAPVFIAGGAMASTLFRDDPWRNALAIAVYFGGGGLGQLLSGATTPLFLEAYGPSFWPETWLGLGIVAAVGCVPAIWAARALVPPSSAAPQGGHARLPYRRMLAALGGYFLFGLGYLIYLTFLVAWMREDGAEAWLVAVVWSTMGIGTMLSPFIWRRVLARSQGGGAMALSNLACGAGTFVALVLTPPVGVLLSAAVVGASFYIVPTAATTFGRKNLLEAQWGQSFAVFTTLFSIGQMIGPVAAGALADLTGGIGPGLVLSGAILLFGAAIAVFQRPLTAGPD